jgi:RNA polymerase sigma-70 factor, ECF subfamily
MGWLPLGEVTKPTFPLQCEYSIPRRLVQALFRCPNGPSLSKTLNRTEAIGIYIGTRTMRMPPTDSIIELSFPGAAAATLSAKPSEIDCEVMHLFDQFRSPLLRYVIAFGVSLHDAEEITQEVFLSLFRHLQLGRSRRNLRGWIFRVAHNLALKQRYANQASRKQMAFDRTIAERQLDPSPNPEEEVSYIQKRRCLLAVVDALPEQDQCCLRLRAEGLRYREIATVLDMSLGAVSISLTRSLARLIRADRR